MDIQGHRGARGLLPENSLPGFQLALDLGVNTLEMDTVVSKDHKVVVSHDPYFSPEICLQPDGRPIPEGDQESFRIYDRTYDEIRSFDCGSIGNARFPGQRATAVRKPLLREVLQFSDAYSSKIGRDAPYYNIETKSTLGGDGVLHPDPAEFVELLLAVLRQMNVLDRSIVQSFDVRTLQEVKRAHPELRTALLVGADSEGAAGKSDVGANLEALGFVPTIYSPEWSLVDGKLIKLCRDANLSIIPWTVNEPAQMKQLVRLGVDGFITDYPDRAMELVKHNWAE